MPLPTSWLYCIAHYSPPPLHLPRGRYAEKLRYVLKYHLEWAALAAVAYMVERVECMLHPSSPRGIIAIHRVQDEVFQLRIDLADCFGFMLYRDLFIPHIPKVYAGQTKESCA